MLSSFVCSREVTSFSDLKELASPQDSVSSEDAFVLSKLLSSVRKGSALILPRSMLRRLRVEFQWFLIALSVLPGKRRAITAHLFPWMACAATMVRSSSSVTKVSVFSQNRRI